MTTVFHGTVKGATASVTRRKRRIEKLLAHQRAGGKVLILNPEQMLEGPLDQTASAIVRLATDISAVCFDKGEMKYVLYFNEQERGVYSAEAVYWALLRAVFGSITPGQHIAITFRRTHRRVEGNFKLITPDVVQISGNDLIPSVRLRKVHQVERLSA